MRILLVGEYSSVHKNLAIGLKFHNVKVTTVSDGDSYKKISADFIIDRREYKIKLLNIFLNLSGLKGLRTYFRIRGELAKLSGFDVVQLINPVAIESFGAIANFLFIFQLYLNNKNIYLCALGDDLNWVFHNLLKREKYSALTNLKWNNFSNYLFSLRYIFIPPFLALNIFVKLISKKIIPGLVDYYMPYKKNKKVCEVIPLPLDVELIKKL